MVGSASSRVSNHESHRRSGNDSSKPENAQAFLREKNALKAATASVERIRSPNRWLS
jgi:hypothetical protein